MPNGIYCAEIDYDTQYLLIGGFTNTGKNFSNGIHVWRILNSEPWLKHFPILHDVESYKLKVKLNLNVVFFYIYYIYLFYKNLSLYKTKSWTKT